MKLTTKQQQIIERFEYPDPISFLDHVPYRYDQLESKPMALWNEGETVVVEGTLASSFGTFRFGRRQSVTNFQVLTSDGLVKIAAFNNPYLKTSNYDAGIVVVVGVVGKDHKLTAKQVTHKKLADVLGIQPQYPLRAGVKNYEIVRLMAKILNEATIAERLPQSLIEAYKLCSRHHALNAIHRPASMEALQLGLRTLKYDEFLRYHLSVALNQNSDDVGIAKAMNVNCLDALLALLPFALTPAQADVLKEITSDLGEAKIMNRLLQGDVGSGKTVVALLSALQAIEAGYQVAFMAPTEVLCRQHMQTYQTLFNRQDAIVLTGNQTDRTSHLEALETGEVSLVFGTHALFQERVVFANLGYVIIDEQHRFGVRQRQKLVSKGDRVDVLMLSATPIPRTLANSLFFDLNVSTIDTYPSHRKKIETTLIEENSIRSIMDGLKSYLKTGQQIYIVCAAIDEDERPGVKNVLAIEAQLTQQFKDYRVVALHGRMKSEEKNDIMHTFNQGGIDILISTTVIEVGMDVHNANMMVVYNAEQFGLATLHQLRGRVGRGALPGHCYLLSNQDSERLKALETSHDGFELSMIDMRMRGIGDVLGVRQSGLPNFVLADIEKDEKILKQAKKDAQLIAKHPENPEYQAIINTVLAQDYLKSI